MEKAQGISQCFLVELDMMQELSHDLQEQELFQMHNICFMYPN